MAGACSREPGRLCLPHLLQEWTGAEDDDCDCTAVLEDAIDLSELTPVDVVRLWLVPFTGRAAGVFDLRLPQLQLPPSASFLPQELHSRLLDNACATSPGLIGSEACRLYIGGSAPSNISFATLTCLGPFSA